MKYLLVPAGAAFFALLPLPIEAYAFVRWIVFVGCAYGAFCVQHEGRYSPFFSVPLGLLALLFNPIFPVYLQRSTWLVLDVMAGTFLAWLGMLSPQPPSPANGRTPREDVEASGEFPKNPSPPNSAFASKVDKLESKADSFAKQMLWASVGSIVVGGLLVCLLRR